MVKSKSIKLEISFKQNNFSNLLELDHNKKLELQNCSIKKRSLSEITLFEAILNQLFNLAQKNSTTSNLIDLFTNIK